MPESSSPKPEQTGRSSLSLRKKVGFALLSVGIAFVFCEILCRLAGIGFCPTFLDRDALRAEQARGAWELDFRGKHPTPAKPPGTLRIVCMGDSCTFGHGIDEDDATYPVQLEEILRRRLPLVEVINAGMVGSTVPHGYDCLRFRILSYQPDVIVAAYGWNDHTVFEAAAAMRRAVLLSSQTGVRRWLIRHSRLLQIAAKCALALRLEAALGRADENARKVPLSEYKIGLRSLVETAQNSRVRVVLVTLAGAPTTDPVICQLYGPSEARLRWHTKYVQATREVARQSRALLVDAAEDFAKHPRRGALIAPDGIHPTAEGAQALASLVASALVDAGVIPRRPAEE